MKKILILFIAALCTFSVEAQTKLTKVYNETINPLTQIENAVNQAKKQKKHVICQLGGNWCIWCLRLADFITKDEEINNFINDNYVYIHVNYNPKNATTAEIQKQNAQLLKRLGNPSRFGYPVLVVLNEKGEVIHLQDSAFLELDKSYDRKKVLRFLQCWTPKAVK